MPNDVVLIVPVGRRATLPLLFAHLLKARDQFTRCELWMNATWEPEDSVYIRDFVKDHPGIFLLKDDGNWRIEKQFYHYGRYYNTIAKDDTIYIKLDDDIVWMETGAIGKLVAARRNDDKPLLIIPNIVNNTFCNTKHQEVGVYPKSFDLTPLATDPIGHYQGDFAEYIHHVFIWHVKNSVALEAYRFEDCTRPVGARTPNHIYAAFGRDISWSTDDETIPTSGIADARRPVLILGSPLFAHYSYTPQKGYLDTTNILKLYEELL